MHKHIYIYNYIYVYIYIHTQLNPCCTNAECRARFVCPKSHVRTRSDPFSRHPSSRPDHDDYRTVPPSKC